MKLGVGLSYTICMTKWTNFNMYITWIPSWVVIKMSVEGWNYCWYVNTKRWWWTIGGDNWIFQVTQARSGSESSGGIDYQELIRIFGWNRLPGRIYIWGSDKVYGPLRYRLCMFWVIWILCYSLYSWWLRITISVIWYSGLEVVVDLGTNRTYSGLDI